jgi:hypothetical protein
MLLLDSKIDKSSLGILLKAVRKGPVCIWVNCEGGDYTAAVDFVDTIKRESLEKNISFVVKDAASAAAYIVLSLNCPKNLVRGGTVRPHAGDVSCSLHMLYLGGIEAKSKKYWLGMIDIMKSIVSAARLDTYITTKELILTPDECQKNGITLREN